MGCLFACFDNRERTHVFTTAHLRYFAHKLFAFGGDFRTFVNTNPLSWYFRFWKGKSESDDGNDGGFPLPGFGYSQFDECVTPPPVCPNENITFWFYTR